MNEIIKAIKERRSVRSYQDKPVEKEKIEQLIECAKWGPSAKDQQKWQFIIVTNKDVIQKISNLIYEQAADKYPMIKERAKTMKDPILYGAPLLIAVTEPEDYHWDKIDGSIAAQNMILTAHSLGLASCYIGMTRTIKDDPKFKDLIKISQGHRLVIAMIFGYSDEKPEPHPRNNDVVKWIE